MLTISKMFKFLSTLCLYGSTINKVFINLFLLVKIGNILEIFKKNQYKFCFQLSSAILLSKIKSLSFSL